MLLLGAFGFAAEFQGAPSDGWAGESVDGADDGAIGQPGAVEAKADELGVKPRARIVDQTTVGVDPVIMLTGPIPATQKLLERGGMKIDDIDLIEINEAFCSVPVAAVRTLGIDPTILNVNGSGCSLG